MDLFINFCNPNFVSIMEKTLFVILLSSFCTGSMAQTENDYLPFAEEGKSWVVTYMTSENSDSYKKTYIVKGDTIIGGVLYKKLFEKDSDLYLYAIREEGKKVFSIASSDMYGKPNTEEFLWYDFNVSEGNKIETERSWLYITGTDCVYINGDKRRRIHIYQAYKNNPDEYNGSGVWVEGVGSDLGPISPYSWGLDKGANSSMDECSTKGQIIFNYSDFVAPTFGEESGMELQYTNRLQQSGRVYDLQGRSIPNNLCPVIYIRDGRKQTLR